MALTLRIWKPPVKAMDATAMYARPLARAIDPEDFALVQTFSDRKGAGSADSWRVNPFVLPPRSGRYLNCLMARGHDNRMLLGCAGYLSAAHALLGGAITDLYGLGRKPLTAADIFAGELYLWGGEVYVRNDCEEPAIGVLQRVNDTSGYLARREYASNDIGTLRRALKRMSFPFHVGKRVTFEEFDPDEQHLDSEINRMFGGVNVRHDLVNSTAIIKLTIGRLLHGMGEAETIRQLLLAERVKSYDAVYRMATLVRRHNVSYPEEIDHIPSPEQLAEVPSADLEGALRRCFDGVIALQCIFTPPPADDVVGEYDIFELPA